MRSTTELYICILWPYDFLVKDILRFSIFVLVLKIIFINNFNILLYYYILILYNSKLKNYSIIKGKSSNLLI